MVAQDAEPKEPNAASVLGANERRKLTATYLNAGAGGLFTTGVVAPIAAVVFGLAGTTVSLLTLAVGVLIFLSSSLALHAAALYVLKRLK